MKIVDNSIFISGATSGIGLAIARQLHAAGNHLLINGRDKAKLDRVTKELKGSVPIQADLSLVEDRIRVAKHIQKEHQEVNWLINNAGLAYSYSLANAHDAFLRAQDEINLNYLSIVHFTDLLLPQLLKHDNSAIINVTSISAFRGRPSIPTYSASKAALQSYTNVLRETLVDQQNLGIFELIPPLVNTPFSKEIGGEQHGIAPEEVADELMAALQANRYTVPVGLAKQFYQAH